MANESVFDFFGIGIVLPHKRQMTLIRSVLVFFSRISKIPLTGRDLRPVHLTQRVRPFQPVKIAGNFLRTG